MLGHFLSALCIAAGPGYEAAHIPALTTQALADNVTKGNPWYFRGQTPNSQQARWLAPYIREVLLPRSGLFSGAVNVDLVTSNDAFGTSFATSFVAAMGEQIPKSLTFNPDPQGLATAVQTTADALAKEAEPRIIVIDASVDVSAVLVKAIRRRGIRSMLIVGGAGSDTYLLNFANEPEERGWRASSPTISTPRRRWCSIRSGHWASSSAEHAGGGDRTAAELRFSAGANDAMRLMVEALRRAHIANTPQSKAEDREKLRAALLSIDSPEHSVPGLDGPLYFDANRDMPRALRFGYYDRGRLVSTPLQLVEVRHPEFIDLAKEADIGQRHKHWPELLLGTARGLHRHRRRSPEQYRCEGRHLQCRSLRLATLWRQQCRSHAYRVPRPDRQLRSRETVGTRRRGRPELPAVSRCRQFQSRFRPARFPVRHPGAGRAFPEPFAAARAGCLRHRLSFGLHLHRPDTTPIAQRPAYADLQLWHPTDLRYFLHSFSISSTLGRPAVFDNDTRNEYGGFDLAIVVHRDVFAFMVKTLVPLFLLMLVVLATLFFPVSLTKERTTIPVTGILTSAVLLISISNQLPSLGYTIALEYMFYVFFALCLMAMCSGFLSEILRNESNITGMPSRWI